MNITIDEIKLLKEVKRLKRQNRVLLRNRLNLQRTIASQLDSISQLEDQHKNSENLNINQLSEFSGLSRLEIQCLVSAGKITQYGIGTSAYFLKSEIMQALKITDNKI